MLLEPLWVSPADAATSVAVGSNIVLNFSETIARGTGTIQLRSGSATGTLIESFDAATSTRLSLSGSQLTIDPTNNLSNSTQYFLVLPSGSIKDVAGNNYAGTSTYDFTTAAPADTTAPTVSSFSPADAATSVSVGSNIVLNFSETIARGTGTIQLRSGSATGTLIESFDAATSTRLSLSGSQLTIDPTNNLSNSTQYFLVLPSGSIKDVAGNNYAGTSTYDFTTALPAATTGDDSLVGTSGNDTLDGLAGNDTLDGAGGNDALTGGSGIDRFRVTSGTDSISDLGNGGADILEVSSGATANATVTAAWTATSATTNAGTANITTAGFGVNLSAVTTGLGFNVTNNGSAATITGSGLADRLTGGVGNDAISGGAGNDVISGRAGADTLRGGAGSDTFKFAAGDSGPSLNLDNIADYTKGVVGTGDLIDYTLNLTFGGSSLAATSSRASINQTTGVATFASGSGETLSDALADIAASLTAATDAVGEFAFFKVNNTGNYHLFVSDGAAGVTTNDIVVQFTDLTSITTLDLLNGNMTITM